MKWTLLLVVLVGGIIAWLNWPAVNAQLQQVQTQLSSGWNSGKMAVMKPDGTSMTVSVPLSQEVWSPRQVAGLQLNLPFDLQPINEALPTQLPAGVQLEVLGGRSIKHEVILTHVSASMRGAMPLWLFNMDGPSASRLSLDLLPPRPTTLLNGFRAQRTDAFSKTTPRVRYRLLLLGRTNHAWFLETHSWEDGDDFEPGFQKMISSVQ